MGVERIKSSMLAYAKALAALMELADGVDYADLCVIKHEGEPDYISAVCWKGEEMLVNQIERIGGEDE